MRKSKFICFYLLRLYFDGKTNKKMFSHHSIQNLFFSSLLYRYTKPQTFADCVGDELPLGWEESYDQIIGRYYINHFDRKLHLHLTVMMIISSFTILELLIKFYIQHAN